MPAASRIVDGLWVGAAPPPGDYTDRFDVIVFAAEEYQPPASAFPGVRVRHFPYDDKTPPSQHDLMTAWSGAEAVARDLRRGRNVLVTCMKGRNRSALVAALAIHLVTGEPGRACLGLVRAKRVDQDGIRALSNKAFQQYLIAMP